MTRNSISAGLGSDLKVAAVGAMAPLLCGLLILVGLIYFGGFGIVLGLGGAVWWAIWWTRRNGGSFFPRTVNGTAFGITTGLTVLVFILAVSAI